MAPEVGLEPTTHRLTADCSTIELLWKPRDGKCISRYSRRQTESPAKGVRFGIEVSFNAEDAEIRRGTPRMDLFSANLCVLCVKNECRRHGKTFTRKNRCGEFARSFV